MSGIDTLILAAAAGAGLGIVFFGGLWLTVRTLPRARNPTLLVLGSFVGRMALAVAGFYLVMDGRWERALACLAGFLIARQFLIARVRPDEATVAGQQDGVGP